MTGKTGHVMNLANSIIGVSLLAMPFCFKQCGITLAITMLILSSVISRMACHFLVKSSTMCRRRNFEFLAFYTFGPSGKLLVELGIIGFMMGTCVAFFVVMGDLGPAIISKIFNLNNNNTLRTSVLIGLGVLVVLPLGLLRNIDSLVTISTATIGFYFLFTIKIFFESSPHLMVGDWWEHVNFWKPEGALQCIPIFAMSLSCQMQLFEIYESIHAPSVEKIYSIVHSALNLCTAVYTVVGLLGYIAYCKASFSGNILLSFTPSLSSEMFKLGFVLSIAVSFPLVIFPCRASLYSLIFKRMPIHHELSQTSSHIPDTRFKWLTISIVSISLLTGLLVPSIELVLGFVGSTIGIAICVIFPSLAFVNLNSKNSSDQTMAKITATIGVLIMVMGTIGNLFTSVENMSVDPYSTNLENSNFLSVKQVPEKNVALELKKEVNGLPLIKPVLPGMADQSKKKPMEDVRLTPERNLVENRRKEPPMPYAPVDQLKETKDVARTGERLEHIQSHSNDKILKKSKDEIKKIKSKENFQKEASIGGGNENNKTRKKLFQPKTKIVISGEMRKRTAEVQDELSLVKKKINIEAEEGLKEKSVAQPRFDIKVESFKNEVVNIGGESKYKKPTEKNETESAGHAEKQNVIRSQGMEFDSLAVKKEEERIKLTVESSVKPKERELNKSANSVLETESKLKVQVRDILGNTKLNRGKRETYEWHENPVSMMKSENENCAKEEKSKRKERVESVDSRNEESKKTEKTKTLHLNIISAQDDDQASSKAELLMGKQEKISNLIKNSAYLSVGLASEKKREITEDEIKNSKFIDNILSR